MEIIIIIYLTANVLPPGGRGYQEYFLSVKVAGA